MNDKSTLKRTEPIQEKNKWQNKHIVKRDF